MQQSIWFIISLEVLSILATIKSRRLLAGPKNPKSGRSPLVYVATFSFFLALSFALLLALFLYILKICFFSSSILLEEEVKKALKDILLLVVPILITFSLSEMLSAVDKTKNLQLKALYAGLAGILSAVLIFVYFV